MPRSRDIIDASPDLKRLDDEGLELRIKHAFLLVSSIPYVTADLRVARGTLIFPLTMATDTTTGKPHDHTAHFAGEKPHYANGKPIAGIINKEETQKLAEGIVSRFYLSSKPENADVDYYVKVRRYVDIISAQARSIEPLARPETRQIVESEDDDSPFVFPDTNSSRAQIAPIAAKVNGQRIAIAGLGGTGSYILDFVAKTLAKEIHLFDDDEFSVHNAYRAPGAPMRNQFRLLKVNYLAEVYSRMHKGVIPHPISVDETNVGEFAGMNFVFLCMDPGPAKAKLIEFLVNASIPFVDTGIGVEAVAEKLVGAVNTITVTPDYKSHINSIPVKADADDDLYASNIQIAELNAMNAAMAVIRWKKYLGFYADSRHEHESTYTIGPNMLTNEHETRT